MINRKNNRRCRWEAEQQASGWNQAAAREASRQNLQQQPAELSKAATAAEEHELVHQPSQPDQQQFRSNEQVRDVFMNIMCLHLSLENIWMWTVQYNLDKADVEFN